MPTLTFDLDLSGNSPYNLISSEAVALTGSLTYRSFAPKYGPYYYESVEVRDAHTLRVLVKDIEYQCKDLATAATAVTGKDLYRTVIVLNTAISNDILVSYQTIGGEYVQDYSAIQVLTNNLLADTRPLGWPGIVGKPQTYDPTMHLHALGDATGFEYLVSALEMVRQTILSGDQIQSDAILRYIDDRMVELSNLVSAGSRDLSYSAMLAAQSAKNTSDTTQSDLSLRQQELIALSTQLSALLQRVQAVEASSALSHDEVSTYLNSYPITYGNAQSPVLSNQLPVGLSSPVQYAGMSDTVLVDEDYYVLDGDGRAHIAMSNVSADYYSGAVLRSKLQIYKEATTGYLKVSLSISVPDTRQNDYTGLYSKAMVVKLHPFDFLHDDGTMGAASAWYCDLNVNNTRIDPTVGQVSVRVLSELNETIVTNQSKVALADTLRKHLFDTRADYNVKGYAQVDNRSAVNLSIPLGTEVVINARLSTISLSDVQRTMSVLMSHSGDITQSTMNGTSLSEQTVHTNPRGGRAVALNVTLA